MKITLAITIYNKEKWVKSILESWIQNVSNKEKIEVIIVFDDLKDGSEKIARQYLEEVNVRYKFLYADDRHEIFCNNLALENATGDHVIFIQDDNWIYDKNWDLVLEHVINNTEKLGGIALLAGAKILPFSFKEDILKYFYKIVRLNIKSILTLRKSFVWPFSGFNYQRIESDRPSKKENFTIHKIKSQPIGVWSIHHVTRPFCIKKNLIDELGGLDKFFMPHMGDDVDLSYKLLERGYKNIYIPFDLLNISTVSDSDKHGNIYVIHCRIITELKNRYANVIKNPQKYKIEKLNNINLAIEQESLIIKNN